MNQDKPDADLTNVLFTVIKNQHPQTVDELAFLAGERTGIAKAEIVAHILSLQSQGRLKLTEQPTRLTDLTTYMKSENAYWYWTIVLFALVTILSVFVLPETAYPFVYVRYVLGTIYVVWLPGYTLTRVLFPKMLYRADDPKKKELDVIERLGLSIGMSLALVPIVGMILIYTPWGIRLAPMVLCLFLLAIAFATVAIIREYQQRRQTST